MACTACKKPGHDIRRCRSLRAAFLKITRVAMALDRDRQWDAKQEKRPVSRDWRIEDLSHAARNIADHLKAGVQ